MRFLLCLILLAVITIAAASPTSPEDNDVPQSLYDVDVQGHENVGEREARQFGFGGFRGGYGGFRGGFGGYRGGFGGYRGGFGGYRGGFGGYRGGFYG